MRRATFVRRAIAPLAVAAGIAAMSGAAYGEAKEVTIALFVAIQANPVEQAIINSFEKVATEDGAARFVVFDSNNSVQKEIANCNDAIAAHKFEAFALKPVAGPPLIACAEKAIAAGIPVIVFGNALGPDPDTAARQVKGLTASVVELAKTNGIAIAELVNDACEKKAATPCEVIYTYGPLAFDWASISRKFFVETIAEKYKSIKIVADGTNNFDPNLARTLIKSLVQVHPEVDVVAADADLGAIGVVAGLKDLGKTPGKDMLNAGEMFGSTCLMPITEARTAAKYAILAARGEPIEQPDVEVCAVFSPTGVAPITAENAVKFTPEW